MRVVGLVGPKRSGKSTAAEVLVRERGFVSIGFADALKELALKVNPLMPSNIGLIRLSQGVDQLGWERAKESLEVRQFLQELGTGVRDIDPRFWIEAWDRTYQMTSAPVVVPDVRFANEAEALRFSKWTQAECLLIRITRPGLNDGDRHISETEQLGIGCQTTLYNNGDIDDLQHDVLQVFDEWIEAPRLSA